MTRRGRPRRGRLLSRTGASLVALGAAMAVALAIALTTAAGAASRLPATGLAALDSGYRGQPGAGAVRGALGGIYRSSQLAGLDHPSGGSSGLGFLAQLVGNWLRSLLGSVPHGAWIALAALLLLAGVPLAGVLLQRSRARLPEPAEGPAQESPALTGVRPERLFGDAEQQRAAGHFREAVRLAFQGLLLATSRRRLLEVDPSWTNSELLLEARRVADLEPALRPLVSQFDAVVYGGRDPGAEGCSQFTSACRAAAEALRS